MLKDKFIQEEIWRLKNKDKPKLKENSVPPNLMDGPIDQRNLKDEKIIKLASGAALDELVEAQQFMKELFDSEVAAGNIPSSMSYDEWIISLKTSLSEGGRVGFESGGSTAAERYEEKIKELTDKGLSRELAEAIVISELSPDAYRIIKKDGGKVVDFAKYAKGKEPKIKTIDIGKYFDLGRRLSSLSQSERDTLKWILNKSFKK